MIIQFLTNLCRFVEKQKILSVLLLIVVALAMRLFAFHIVSGDYRYYVSRWIAYIIRQEGVHSWKDAFHNYQMPYIYLLTLIAGLPIKKLYLVKLLSILFELISAVVIFKIVKIKYKTSFAIPYLASAVFLFVPTVYINGAYWAQCDSIYTTFLLFSAYYGLKGKNVCSFIFFGIAFAFKAQAVFFAPVLLVMWFNRRVNLLYFLIIPAIYFISIVPAWITGRGLMDLLTIYFWQSNYYHDLSKGAPNLYACIPNTYYDIVVPVGLLLAGVVIGLAVYRLAKQNKPIDTGQWIEIMYLFVLLVPFVLPKMHERFFFPADVFAVLYLFYFCRRYYIPCLSIGASILVYPPVRGLMYIPEYAMLPACWALFCIADFLFKNSYSKNAVDYP